MLEVLSAIQKFATLLSSPFFVLKLLTGKRFITFPTTLTFLIPGSNSSTFNFSPSKETPSSEATTCAAPSGLINPESFDLFA